MSGRPWDRAILVVTVHRGPVARVRKRTETGGRCPWRRAEGGSHEPTRRHRRCRRDRGQAAAPIPHARRSAAGPAEPGRLGRWWDPGVGGDADVHLHHAGGDGVDRPRRRDLLAGDGGGCGRFPVQLRWESLGAIGFRRGCASRRAGAVPAHVVHRGGRHEGGRWRRNLASLSQGGGASDIQTCSVSVPTCADTAVPRTDPRLVVAGGGGGGGEDPNSATTGGGPGGSAGAAGSVVTSGSGGAGVDVPPGGTGGPRDTRRPPVLRARSGPVVPTARREPAARACRGPEAPAGMRTAPTAAAAVVAGSADQEAGPAAGSPGVATRRAPAAVAAQA